MTIYDDIKKKVDDYNERCQQVKDLFTPFLHGIKGLLDEQPTINCDNQSAQFKILGKEFVIAVLIDPMNGDVNLTIDGPGIPDNIESREGFSTDGKFPSTMTEHHKKFVLNWVNRVLNTK